MDIKELRNDIDRIDGELTKLFKERMEIAANIAKYKKENHLPVFNKEREREVLCSVTAGMPDELQGYTKTLYETIFNVSRSHQKRIINPQSSLSKLIEDVTASTPCERPDRAVVACQGVEGAYAQFACDKMFPYPSIVYCRGFNDVFKAVDSGLCRYGVLPVENSTAGTVNKVYDLMKEHKFYIVHSLKLFIRHSLLAPEGVELSDIKEVFSHEQALNQCSEFLASLGVKITPCENTAVAAKMVAASGRKDCASIGSKESAELYGLKVLKTGVQNTDNNYTRFICISKKPEIYPGAKKTSFMMTIPHEPGSLYNILSRFAALGLNMTKLESRPIPGSNFEFMFYFDIDASVYSDNLKALLSELENDSEQFSYLGSYTEE
ncbi:MAG: bifunctional chorismate mutase/prephenate dehydratase [Clostridia bacterium]|nr:bifunctional chorismate mutase/prephenate dehydratase [Clostridia bacterium]